MSKDILKLYLQPATLNQFFPFLAIVTETPECRIDRDCPSKLACISETCQNPCNVNNPCSSTQKCVVIDSQPSRSVSCICPEGAIFGKNGECTQGNKGLKPNRAYFTNNYCCWSYNLSFLFLLSWKLWYVYLSVSYHNIMIRRGRVNEYF